MSFSLTITETPTGLAVSYDGSAPIALHSGTEAKTLSGLFLALRAGAIASPNLRDHVVSHQTVPDTSCSFCKLEGRVLSSQGRTRPAETKWASRVPQPGTAAFLAAAAKILAEGDTAAKAAARAAREAEALSAESRGIAVANITVRRATRIELDF